MIYTSVTLWSIICEVENNKLVQNIPEDCLILDYRLHFLVCDVLLLSTHFHMITFK